MASTVMQGSGRRIGVWLIATFALAQESERAQQEQWCSRQSALHRCVVAPSPTHLHCSALLHCTATMQ
jgi:hypothetical protein